MLNDVKHFELIVERNNETRVDHLNSMKSKVFQNDEDNYQTMVIFRQLTKRIEEVNSIRTLVVIVHVF